MNTGVVSQPPVAAGEATADRSRSAGRKDASDNQGGAFSGLLAKLANSPESGARQPESVNGASGNGDDSSQVADWLLGNGNAEEAREGDGRGADLEQVLAEPDNSANGMTDIDVKALMQILSGSGALADASGFAAIAGRVANGTVTEAETVLMQSALTAQQDGEALSPEQLILATLAKANVRTGEPASDDAKTTTATLTVLRRETHLAPVGEAVPGWAARLVAEGNVALRASAQPGNGATEDTQQLPATNGMERAEEVQLANPQAAVTATRDGQLGADWRRGTSPIAEPQVAADALSSAVAQGSAPTAGRSDALVNTGLAPSFTQQIADRVTTEAGALVTQTGRSDAATFGVKHESPVKVLHIQLQPADLGVVTIRMSVKDNALRLDLEVGRGETASLIQRDRDALSALLRSAGYLIEGVDVRIADASGTSAQGGGGQSNTPTQGGQSGSSQADARSPGQRPQNERGNNAFGNGRNGEGEQADRPAHSGGVYI